MATVISPPESDQIQNLSASRERLIEQQLSQTRRQVKLIDLLSAVLLLAAGMLVYLLSVALVDHWVFGLGQVGRVTALALLVLGGGGYLGLIGVHFVMRQVNPAYAAWVIERNTPGLKNSLLNYLLFRSHRDEVRDVVYRALEEQAAAVMARTETDTAVDQGHMIRLAYLLAGVMAVCALYTVVSPKSTLQTLRRVASPLAEIARPSRVQIEDVQPGDGRFYHGQTVPISARVIGLREKDPVTLVYSTADGQTTNRVVLLTPTEDGLRQSCQFPPNSQGLQQDVLYTLQAGDATTRQFQLTVLPAPTIVVERIEYEFPAYTRMPPQTAARAGDIKALEGTRVTIHARANQPIRSAFVEFQSAALPANGGRSASSDVLPLETSGREASASFVLELKPDRQTPKRSSYQLRFVNEDGQRNDQPIRHQIDVTPDLPPEIELLTPERTLVKVPESGRQLIELRAVDPDFGLAAVVLHLAKSGAETLERKLLHEPQGRDGQAVVRFDFQPRELKLKAGAVITYWGTAYDNRNSPRGKAEPNSSETRRYQLEVIAAEQPALARADGEKGDGPGQPPNAKSPDGAARVEGGQPGQPAAREAKNDGSSSPDSAASRGSQSSGKENDKPDDKPGGSSKSGGKASSGSGKTSSGDQKGSSSSDSGDKSSGQGARGSQSSDGGKSSGSKSGDSGKSGESNSSEKSGGTSTGDSGQKGQSAESKSGGKPSGSQSSQSGQSGAESGEKSAASEGGRSSSGQSDKNQGNKTGPPKGDPSGQRDPQAEPLHEGEAIEKILQYLKERQQNAQPQNSGSQSESGAGGKDKSGSQGNQENSPQSAGSEQSQGQQSQGQQSQGQQSQGQQSQGQQSQGQQGQGQQSQGQQGQGQQSQGQQGQGQQSQGQQSQGQQSQGQQSQGQQSQGQQSQGQQSQGQQSQGQQSQGQQSQGQQSQGQQSQGQQSQGQQSQGQQSQGQQSQGQQSQGQQSQGQQSQGQQSQGQQSQGQQSQGQQSQGQQSQGQQSQGQQSQGQQGQGQQSQGQQGQGQQQGSNPGQSQQEKGSSGQGGQQQGGGEQKESKSGSGGQEKQQGSQGSSGKSGGGKQSPDKGGSAGAQGENKDRAKQNKSSGGSSQQSGGAQSPSNSQKQSSSQGGEGGDRSGGGKKGGGQGGQQAGNDKAGSQSGGDQGAGAASEPGQGEQSKGGGNSQIADHPTGISGGSEGNGTKTERGTSGQKKPGGQQPPSGASTPSAGSEPQSSGEQSPDPAAQPGLVPGTGAGGLPFGGGLPADTEQKLRRLLDEVPDGERANLDYARKATDMALDYLKNQKHTPDPKLLEQLGWTPEELQRMLARWEQLRRSARDDERGAHDLLETLRGLGLRPPTDKLRRGPRESDKARGLQDTGAHSTLPQKYQDQFNAFKKGASRAQD